MALLQAVSVRVVPECACIRRLEFVAEGLARPDRALGEAGNTVHGNGQPDAVPVNRRVLG